jgi:hypothetical protein
LAAVIGAMAVAAGGQVLLGKLPDYYVIDWLPWYNFGMGVVSLGVTAALIWRASRWAGAAAGTTFGLHLAVMLLLLTAYRAVVAPDSLVAMTVRLTVWLVILGLLAGARRQAPGAGG